MKQIPSQDVTPPVQPATAEPPFTSQVVDAVYQDGVFKPLKPLNLPPGTPIQLRIAGASHEKQPNGSLSASDDLEKDLFTGPTSRAPVRKNSLPPLFYLIPAILIIALIGYFLLRHRGANNDGGSAGSANNASELPADVKPAPVFSGPPLAPPNMVAEIKIPASAASESKPFSARDMAVDSQGNLYVISTPENVIRKYDEKGSLLSTFGNTPGKEPIFKELFSIAIDKNDIVYALDATQSTIFRFNVQGERSGDPIQELGYAPLSLSIAPNGEILVAVAGSANVVRLNTFGERLESIGKLGKGAGEFSDPSDVLQNDKNELYVIDSGNLRVQHLGAGNTLINEWRPVNFGPTDQRRFALDKEGRLYLTGPSTKDITVYNQKNEIIGKWPLSDMEAPTGIFIDNKDFLYVSDSISNVVRKFKLPA